jgi:phytoene desaturase
MSKKKVLIAGAGLAGLATALRLAKRGYEVEIVEKNSQAGGRLGQIKKDGFTFDTGPSFFSMTYEFDEFARDCGIELPFRFVELDPLYVVNFSDNPRFFYLYKDPAKLAPQFRDVEPRFEEKFRRYLLKSGRLFHSTFHPVIKSNFDSLPHYFLSLMRVNPLHLPVIFRNFYQQVKRYFRSREARQIISLVSFFLGRTPFNTMGVYTLLSYTEFRHNGYYNVEGGMYRIVEGLLEELRKANMKITYNTEIIGYKGRHKIMEALTDRNGNNWKADIFLINGDAAVFRGRVLNRKAFSEERLLKKQWTMGYLTFYLGINCKLPNVNHHNYFLGSNYEVYARDVQKNPGTLEKPYYYVNVVSKLNPACAPEGCESLFFVCPVPNLQFKADWSDSDTIVDSIISDFSKRIGTDIGNKIVSKTIYTPVDWQNQFNLFKGSGLGLAHTFGQIGGFRPANFDEEFSNLFYTGASTIPGAGLPMSIISSRLAFDRIEKYSRRK